MKKAIVQGFSFEEIQKSLNVEIEVLIQATINVMCYVGEQCILTARMNGDYNDITGNLRSSIGYVVLHNGRPVKYGKPKRFKGTDSNGKQGPSAAEKFLNELAGNYPDGIVLIVVAGMKYAVYLEAIHNRDVITSAELLADELVPQMLKQLGIVSTK